MTAARTTDAMTATRTTDATTATRTTDATTATRPTNATTAARTTNATTATRTTNATTAARTTRRRPPTAWLALGAATLLAACGGATPPQRDGAGAVAKAGEVSLLDLREGDCVGDLRERIDNPDGGHNGVPRVNAVPCGEPHDGEVLQIAPIDSGQDWPGEAIVAGEAARGRPALRRRLDRLARRTGAKAGQLTLLTFKPIQERWEFEDQHEIVYLVLYARPQRDRLGGGVSRAA